MGVDLEGLRAELALKERRITELLNDADANNAHIKELSDELYNSRCEVDRLEVELDRLHNALAKEMGESS